jgi:RimJ/RimL family protein N-acetyltransferase
LLIDVPETLDTPRLVLSCPRAGDGPLLAGSVRESLAELKPWMPWATDAYSEQDGELWCRRAAANFLQRSQLQYLVRGRESGAHVGTLGAFAFDWDVPKAEIGYWLRTGHTGHGFMTEAVNALAGLLLERLCFNRVELRTDVRNERSGRVAGRCGFALEATLRSDSRGPDGSLRDTCVYARTSSTKGPAC